MKEVLLKEICQKGSSSLKQKDVEGQNGQYPVFGASGQISKIDSYHQEQDYIAIVKDGSGIGRVMFLPAKSSVIGTMQYILPKGGYDIKYIGYCLQSLDLSKYKQGAAIPHIYFRDYGERVVNVAENLSDQQRIVSYLDSAFTKIDQLKANAEKQMEEAKALFAAALQSEMEPKEGWEEKTLGEVIVNLRTGLNPRVHFKLNTEDAKGYYVTVRELKGFTFEVDNKTDRINDSAISRINQRSNIQIGDVLYSGTGTIGRTAIVEEEPLWWNVKEGVYILTPNYKLVQSRFLVYLLHSPQFHSGVISKTSGTTVRSIPMKELVKVTFSLPPLSDQDAIVAHLDNLSAKVRQLEANFKQISAECDALKQAILRETFN